MKTETVSLPQQTYLSTKGDNNWILYGSFHMLLLPFNFNNYINFTMIYDENFKFYYRFCYRYTWTTHSYIYLNFVFYVE